MPRTDSKAVREGNGPFSYDDGGSARGPTMKKTHKILVDELNVS